MNEPTPTTRTSAAADGTTLLSIRGLSARVEDKGILHAIDLDVRSGETHVLMGPNGAGKSTLGHVIMGDPAYEVSSAQFNFNGQPIADAPTHKRSQAGIFLSFQAPVEMSGVSLRSFLRAAVANHPELDMKGRQFKTKLAELCEQLDMNPAYLDRDLGVGFSGGEKKKVEMLQLLLLRPKLAILDETDSGLDVDALGVVSRGIEAFREEVGGALIIITHNTRILSHVPVDRVHVMAHGSLVAEGDASLIGEIDSEGYARFVR